MRGCDHQPIYSGRTSLECTYQWICSRCGEMGWSKTYNLAQVNHEEFYRQRVIHGWAAPPRPPRVPTLPPPVRLRRDLLAGIALFACLFTTCALAAIPWGRLGPIMPLWMSLVGMGVALVPGTLCYLGWKQSKDGHRG